MDSRKLAELCRSLAENKKAENIVLLDVAKQSTVTDFFVIATGTSEPHVRAIVQEIADTLKVEHGVEATGRDGLMNAPWIVLDYFDVIVHVMRPEVRELYQLEELWKDAPRPKIKRNSKSRTRSTDDEAKSTPPSKTWTANPPPGPRRTARKVYAKSPAK